MTSSSSSCSVQFNLHATTTKLMTVRTDVRACNKFLRGVDRALVRNQQSIVTWVRRAFLESAKVSLVALCLVRLVCVYGIVYVCAAVALLCARLLR